MARARPDTGGDVARPHLQKGLTRGTRELRRAGRDTEGRDYLILITLIILIMRETRGLAPKDGMRHCATAEKTELETVVIRGIRAIRGIKDE